MKKISSAFFFCCLLFLPLHLLAADTVGLVSALTSQLGVSQEQASGGIGALLGSANSNMGDDKYSSLLSMVPSLTGLASDAAGSSSSSGLLGAASSMLGGAGGSMDQAAQLMETFKGLGLDSDMLGKFTQIALDYVQGEGGVKAMELLQGALQF
jgi:hypothetical protein